MILQRLMLSLMRYREKESLLVKVGRVHSPLGLLIGYLGVTAEHLIILDTASEKYRGALMINMLVKCLVVEGVSRGSIFLSQLNLSIPEPL